MTVWKNGSVAIQRRLLASVSALPRDRASPEDGLALRVASDPGVDRDGISPCWRARELIGTDHLHPSPAFPSPGSKEYGLVSEMPVGHECVFETPAVGP